MGVWGPRISVAVMCLPFPRGCVSHSLQRLQLHGPSRVVRLGLVTRRSHPLRLRQLKCNGTSNPAPTRPRLPRRRHKTRRVHHSQVAMPSPHSSRSRQHRGSHPQPQVEHRRVCVSVSIMLLDVVTRLLGAKSLRCNTQRARRVATHVQEPPAHPLLAPHYLDLFGVLDADPAIPVHLLFCPELQAA